MSVYELRYNSVANHVSNYTDDPAEALEHRLTASEVREIRERYAAGGVTHNQLANEFGTSRANIGLIINRKNWKGV